MGAANLEDCGYYFWWGDTVGYRRENGAWVAADGSTSGFSFSTGNTPTYGKNNAALLSEGWIDSSENLVRMHDAVKAHLGSPWRMPTDADFSALLDNCDSTWVTTNGMSGRLVTGKGNYADRSIFLPAAGYDDGSSFWGLGSYAYYWSSTPNPNSMYSAFGFSVNSDNVGLSYTRREYGASVRPVRDFAQ